MPDFNEFHIVNKRDEKNNTNNVSYKNPYTSVANSRPIYTIPFVPDKSIPPDFLVVELM